MNNLFRIAEELGIHVEYCRLPLNGSVSTYDEDGDFILMDYSLIQDGGQERVHMAHELGHCITGSFYNVYTPYDVRAKHEYRADKWAVHELIPFEIFQRAIKAGNTEIWQLAEYFDVTEDFIRRTEYVYQCEGKLFE